MSALTPALSPEKREEHLSLNYFISRAKHFDQVPQFVIHLGGRGDGLCDFFAQQFAKAAAQAMHGHAEGIRRNPEAGGHVHLGSGTGFAPDKNFERIELFHPAGGGEFRAESGEHSFQHGDRPALFISPIRSRGGISRLGEEAGFSITLFVQRDVPLAAAALLRLLFAPFAFGEIIEGTEEERAEPAALRVGDLKILVFEEAGEELLGQVLRVLRSPAEPPRVGVERVPVRPAKTFQRLLGFAG